MTEPNTSTRFTLTDSRMDQLIGLLLRTGVLLASVVVLAGGILYMVRHPHARSSYRIFAGEPAALRELAPLFHRAVAADPTALIQLGLLLLIATPVARVLFAAVAFALERDWLYTVISTVILAVLLLSFFLMH